MGLIHFPALCILRAGLALFIFLALSSPVVADEKGGMPDLGQIDNTCLPTATANLMLWFGKHGYPNLIPKAGTEQERELLLVHRLMADTDARFDWGTQRKCVTSGIAKYIHESGYDAEIEYHGKSAWYGLSQDWLKENDDPNKGFILLLSYGHYNGWPMGFSEYGGMGHAVTLVNALDDTLVIHDPDHLENEVGRKIVTIKTPEYSSVLLLSGSQLEAPEDCEVWLSGAICVVMHPTKAGATSTSGATDIAATGSSSSNPSSPPSAAPSAPSSSGTSVLLWLFALLFKK